MHLKRSFLGFVLSCLVCSPLLAAPTPLASEVTRALRARHGTFLKRLQRLRQTKQVAVLLGQIALAAKQLPYVRERPLIALRTYDAKRAVQVCQALLKEPKQRTSLRRRALRSLSLLAPKAALPHATKALHNRDFTIRAVAIKALVRQPSSPILRLLQQRTKIEPNTYLKKVLQTQILFVQKKLQVTATNTPTRTRPVK